MNSIEDKKLCIICGKNANATGSHIIPAHLIKNCVGKRSYENSFDIDIENLDVNRFLGRYIQHNELENIEKEVLLNALNITHWNRTLAAKKLGMTFRSLRYRLKKFGLDTEDDE